MKSPIGIDSSSSDSEAIAETRSQELSDHIKNYTPSQPVIHFIGLIEEFQKLIEIYPENKNISRQFAISLNNAVKLFGERKNFADMLNILDELDIYQQKTKSEEVSEYLSEAISVTIYYLHGSWDTEGTSKLLGRLRTLIKTYPNNRAILLNNAKSYSNAIARFCSDRHNFICDRFLFEFRMFSNKYKDDVDIQIEFAQSLTNIIGTLAKEDRTSELVQIIDELKRLAKRFPKNEKIQLFVTRANILSSLSSTSTN